MKPPNLTDSQRRKLVDVQRDEITQMKLYSYLARRVHDPRNSRILRRMVRQEKEHYAALRRFTGRSPGPRNFHVYLDMLLTRVFGLTFILRLIEKNTNRKIEKYEMIKGEWPASEDMLMKEVDYEYRLISGLNDDSLRYTGSIVLGLNDALIELLGSLAGLTLALGERHLIIVSSFIVGLVGSLSIGASEFMSTRMERAERSPFKSFAYTAGAFFITTLLLISPYLLQENIYLGLAISVVNGIVIIAAITYYGSVVQDMDFKKRFGEMLLLSLGIAALALIIGFGLKFLFL